MKPIPIPIILFGFISNQYWYQYICLAPYQTDTDTDNRFKPILTDYLQVLFYISANFTDTHTYIHHTDTNPDYPVWIHIRPIPIPIPIIGIQAVMFPADTRTLSIGNIEISQEIQTKKAPEEPVTEI